MTSEKLIMDSNEFIVDAEGFTNVYVDGCYTHSGVGGYGVYWGPDNSNNSSGKSQKGATLNIAEIQAAICAIKQAEQLCIKKLRINTDVKLICDAVELLIPEWKRNNWRSLWDGQPIEHRSYFEDLDKAISTSMGMTIEFNHIPGHSSDKIHQSDNPQLIEAEMLAQLGAGHRRKSWCVKPLV